jgi:hypothetical protein
VATLEALFRGELLDALAAAGFERVRRTTLAVRSHDDILQWVRAGKQSPGFSVDFAVQPLWVPEAHLVVQPGGSIASAKSPFGKLGTASVRQVGYLRGEPSIAGAELGSGYLWPLDPLAIAPIVRALRRMVLPWLDGARDVAGLVSLLGRERWASYHHQDFMRAAALARLDRIDDAKAGLSAAIAGYQEHLAAGASWCSERIDRCNELTCALTAREHQPLLQRWAETTRAALLAE